jgi:hypothetical protein
MEHWNWVGNTPANHSDWPGSDVGNLLPWLRLCIACSKPTIQCRYNVLILSTAALLQFFSSVMLRCISQVSRRDRNIVTRYVWGAERQIPACLRVSVSLGKWGASDRKLEIAAGHVIDPCQQNVHTITSTNRHLICMFNYSNNWRYES